MRMEARPFRWRFVHAGRSMPRVASRDLDRYPSATGDDQTSLLNRIVVRRN